MHYYKGINEIIFGCHLMSKVNPGSWSKTLLTVFLVWHLWSDLFFDWWRILHFGWHYKGKRRYKECGYTENREIKPHRHHFHTVEKETAYEIDSMVGGWYTCHINTELNLDLLTNRRRNINTAIHSLYIMHCRWKIYCMYKIRGL